MPLLARCFDLGVGIPAALLFLRRRLRVPDILDKLDSLCLDILVVALWLGRDPLARGRCSSVGGRSKSSIAYFGSDFVLFGHRTVYSHNRMGGLVDCLETGFGEHGPSI